MRSRGERRLQGCAIQRKVIMKKLYLTALLALPLLATPSYADGCFLGYCSGHPGLSFRFSLGCNSSCCKTCVGGCQLGPWYTYWPLEANFITPAPTGFPYWPQPQALTTTYAPAPGISPAPLMASAPARDLQQT